MRTLCGRKRQPLRTASVPITATGTIGRAGLEREPADAALGRRARRATRAPSENISTASARARIAFGGGEHVLVAGAADDGNAPSEFEDPAHEPVLEELLLGHVVDGPPQAGADHERVEERPVVRAEDHGPRLREVLAADAREPEDRWKTGCRTARTSQ